MWIRMQYKQYNNIKFTSHYLTQALYNNASLISARPVFVNDVYYLWFLTSFHELKCSVSHLWRLLLSFEF